MRNKPMEKSNIQLHTKEYSTKLNLCQVYNRLLFECGTLRIGYQEARDQILALFEPVELKALGDEEIIAEYESWTDINHNDKYQMKGLRGVSQATIRKNQAKGQLYRLKEGL